jgi:Condensin complex subunit 2
VRKLKHDIWNHLDTKLQLPASKENNENMKPAIKRDRNSLTKVVGNPSQSESMSFKDMLRDLSSDQGQKDATLPFYFICLLHLANEKVRAII